MTTGTWQAIPRKPGLRKHTATGKVQARYRAADGKFRTQVADDVRGAERWRRGQLTALDSGQHGDPSDRTTVAEFALQGIESRPHRGSTAKRYRGMLTHLDGSTLGSMRLSAVKPMHVQAWIAERSVTLAPSTLDRLFKLLRGVFRSATENGLIHRSPCVGIVLPEVQRTEYQPLMVSQVMALADAMPSRYRAAVIVQGTVGLRVGELLGLRVEGFDRTNKVLRVRQQLDQSGKVGPVKVLHHGVRDVPLPPHVATAIAQHILSSPPDDTGLLFTTVTGKPIRYDVYSERVYKPAVAVAGLPTGTTTHALRHHAASEMLHRGVPPGSVARIRGHSLAELLKTYARALPSGDDIARQAMAAAWNVSSGVSSTAAK